VNLGKQLIALFAVVSGDKAVLALLRLSRTLRLRAALVMSDAIDECPFRFNGKGTTAFLLRLKNSRNLKGLKKT
jgi:hypothetical protein